MKYKYNGKQPIKLVANNEKITLTRNQEFDMLKKEYDSLHDIHKSLISEVETEETEKIEEKDDSEVEDKE